MEKPSFGLLSTLASHLPNIIVIVLLIYGGLFAFKEFKAFTTRFGLDIQGIKDTRFDEQQRRIDELNRRYQQLSENIARAQTNIVSGKEIEEMFRETVDSRVQEIVKENKEQVAAIGKAIATLQRNLQMDVAPAGSHTFESRTGQPTTIENIYVYADSQNGERGIRLAQVVFDHSDSTFTIDTDPLEIHAEAVRTQQVTGNFNHYVELDAYNPRDQIYRDKAYGLSVDTVVVAERRIKQATWHILQPHLEGGLGSNFGTNTTVGFDVGLSLFAYGRTSHDNYLRFARVGVGFTDDTDSIFGSFSPIGLNVRTIGVPFLKDTWIFPGLSLNNNGDFGFAANLSTTF